MVRFKFFLKIVLFSSILASSSLFILYQSVKQDLPDVTSLKELKWITPMSILSSEGKLISQFGEKKRIALTFEEVPQTLKDALLATEDDRFYYHFGVDPIGMGRAVLGKLMGQDKGGASTITMQVARNFFLTREITYTRKLREIFLSFHIEKLLTKDEILLLYINKIELGHRSFGFGAAAQVYYGKDINELTLAQYAVLAGLPKAPSTLNPIRSPKRAKARRSVVLHRMLVSGYITQEDFEQANAAPITGKRHGAEIELSAPYVAEMAHQKMIEMFGKEDAYTSGYRVFTTVSSSLQQAATNAVVTNLYNYDERHGYRGPLFSLRPEPEEGDDISAKTDSTLQTNNIEKDTSEPENGESSQELLTGEITDDELKLAFEKVDSFQNLLPAVVMDVGEKMAFIRLANGQNAEIQWQGMSWAREYINDQKQGIPPKLAQDILNVGDMIYVKLNSDSSYQLSQLPAASSALISISPDDGAIKAAVGGFSFKQSQFNRVTQAKRQVGSNIKPFIYSAALEHGYTLASLINDAPINHWDKSSGVVWRPKNSPEEYIGPMRIKLALAQSKNVVSVRLLQSMGLDYVISYLSSFGFSKADLPRNESLALGSASLTPMEIVTGFATFANGGFLIEPYIIERVETEAGEVIYQADPALACENCQVNDIEVGELAGESFLNSDLGIMLEQQSNESEPLPESDSVNLAPRVISEQNAFLVTQALYSAIWGADWSVANKWQGSGFRARDLKRRDIAGKTGTTNESKDAWFTGYSRRLVTSSWIGFDDPSKNLGKSVYNSNLDKNQITGGEFGAKSAQPAWILFMEEALKKVPFEAFEPPSDIVSVRIDKATGKLSNKINKTSEFEYFKVGTQPTEYVTDENIGIFQQTEKSQKVPEEIF
ncbi:MAG: penicillin-binding protein 1A [Colwellia sp.]